MSIKIMRSTEAKVTNMVVTIMGLAGLGKTSLGLTAKDVILFDFEDGVKRARKLDDAAIVQCNKWQDISTLTEVDLKDYSTIVIDTGGKMLQCLSEFIIESDFKNKNRATGNLSQQGFGALGVAFSSFIFKLKSYRKDIVILCHTLEKEIKEVLTIRLDVVGGSKEEIMRQSDLIGRISLVGKNRVLSFSQEEGGIAKNCRLDDVIINVNNHTELADIIVQARINFNAKSEAEIKREDEIKAGLDYVDGCIDATSCNDALEIFKKSDITIKKSLMDKAKSLNLVFDKETKQFVDNAPALISDVV